MIFSCPVCEAIGVSYGEFNYEYLQSCECGFTEIRVTKSKIIFDFLTRYLNETHHLILVHKEGRGLLITCYIVDNIKISVDEISPLEAFQKICAFCLLQKVVNV
jgi:hypothetical protein